MPDSNLPRPVSHTKLYALFGLILTVVGMAGASIAVYVDKTMQAHENKEYHAGAKADLQDIKSTLNEIKTDINNIDKRLSVVETTVLMQTMPSWHP